jgi:membrane-associated protein
MILYMLNSMELLFKNVELIQWGGLLIIAALIFAETGLLLGLVVPGGETLVFTAGLLVSTNTLDVSIVVLLLILIASGLAGDISGYFIGSRFGRKLYKKKDTWYFKQQYLHMAESFIKKHKKTSIIAGKFFPIIRPFTPVISGTTYGNFASFVSLSAVSVIFYMSLFSLAGYFLGQVFPQLQQYIGWILPISIVVTLIPVILQVRKNKKKASGDLRS